MKQSMWALAACGLAACAGLVLAAVGPLDPPANSPRRADPSAHAIINATVHVGPGETIEKATIVIRGGKIESVTAGAAAPAGVQSWDAAGLHVYAGLVEPYLETDVPAPDRDAPGTHWSPRVMPEREAGKGKALAAAASKGLRDMGYVAAALAPKGGVFRGASAVVSLAEADRDASQARPAVYVERAYQALAFDTGGGTDGESGRWEGYPNSQMGAIALLRQTLGDADWQQARRAAGEDSGQPSALDALSTASGGGLPLWFNVEDELEVIRAWKVADEFKRPAVVVGSGLEFVRLDAIVAGSGGKRALVVPVNFPKKPSVASIGDAEGVGLRELMTWEQAPTNLRRLSDRGVPVALTTAKLKDRSSFMANVRLAIRHGLKEDAALAMLTTTPAKLLGVDGQLGTVEAGKRASLVVLDGPLFASKSKVRDVWVDGKRHEVSKAPIKLTGTWEMTLTPGPATPGTILLSFDKDNNLTVYKTEGEGDAAEEKTTKGKNVRVDQGRVSFTIEHEPLGMPGVFVNSGTWEGKSMSGAGTRSDGARYTWTATKTSDEAHKPKPKAKKEEAKKDDAEANADAKPDAKGDAKPDAKPEAKADALAGTWSLTATGGPLPPDGLAFTLKIARGADGGLSGTISGPMGEVEMEGLTFDAGTGALQYSSASPGGPVTVRATITGDTLTGNASGGPMNLAITGSRVSGKAGGEGGDEDAELVKDVPEKLGGYPFGAYAYESVPGLEKVALVNATVWTSGPAGKIENAAVVMADGKIVYVGAAAGMPRLADEFKMIDVKGRHVTPGIIDCHSHTGISKGVNESGQTVTAEVRIGDVTDPDAMSWYWQLAGGVTTVNSLHGSANPIGGQNQVNKNRWGAVNADDLHFEGATSGIKFALGENVKQSNWGDRATWRYPQTRMGVETIIRDRLNAAKDYAAAQKTWKDGGKKGLGPRRDLEMECLAEILAKTRLIHCHSYRQDEILMLARVAQDYGFKIGSYQHILEGYKVAEAVRDFSYGGSAFSDWWGFKIEVQDAIPQNGPIMFEAGANVSYNSDSDELARRLNVEAGKARKYSRLADGTFSVSEEVALKFVTINPAKQLKIEDRVGSLEVGKDADVVVWNGYPLSSLSKVERTYIDGREYFSLEKDAALRTRNAVERQRLVQKILAEPKKGKKDADGKDSDKGKKDAADALVPPKDEDGRLMGRMLDDAKAWRRERAIDLLRRGQDPDTARQGDCGCGW